MGIRNTKMRDEIKALKAEIVTMERRQAYLVEAAVKQAEVRLSIERERTVQEERSRADQFREQRSVAELENELLKEMVAAEQINVKLQEERNQALKWELLRQGGTQEKFDSIVNEVPGLGDTLRADTAHVVHEATTYGMSEAIEHVVSGLGDVEEELRQAFVARDKGRTGALGGPNFKDALRECLPNMPRAERCLLTLRFARDEDQSIDYSKIAVLMRELQPRVPPTRVQFLEFCRQKAQTRERQKSGLAGVLAATRSVGPLGVASREGKSALAVTIPSLGKTEQKRSGDASTCIRGIPQPAEDGHQQEIGAPEVSKQDVRHQALHARRERVDPEFAVLAARKIADVIDKRGKDLELMFKRADPAGAGVIPVKDFSECLRSLNVTEVAEGKRKKRKLLLTRSDRKALYRTWAVHGQVHYNDFLIAGGYAESPLLRYSRSLTTDRHPSLARHNTSPTLPRSAHAQGIDEPSSPRLQGRKTDKPTAMASWAGPRPEEADEELLPARNEVVLAHLSEVLEEGEDAFFAEFEKRDADGFRLIDEENFMDAMTAFAPAITAEQALDVFRARSCGADGFIDYDKFFKELRKMARPEGFQLGDDVLFRMEDRKGRLHWVHGQVVSRDDDSTYTVRFKSSVPGRGYVEECGVIETRLRVRLRKETPVKKTKKLSVAGVTVKATSWWAGLSKRLANTKGAGADLISIQLKRLLNGKRDCSRANKVVSGRRKIYRGARGKRQRRSKESGGVKNSTTEARADESSVSSESHHNRISRDRRSTAAADSEASGDVSSSSRDSLASTSDTEQREDDFEQHQHKGLLGGNIADASPPVRSPLAASNTGKRRGISSGSDSGDGSGSDVGRDSGRVCRSGGTVRRRTVELPVIQVVSSPPRGKLQDSSHGYHRQRTSPSMLHRRDPAVDRFSGSGRTGTGRNATLRHGRDQRKSSGGLKSLEALGDNRIETKFDLYQKRTRAALSSEKQI